MTWGFARCVWDAGIMSFGGLVGVLCCEREKKGKAFIARKLR